jgi:signal transduction histidine kinase
MAPNEKHERAETDRSLRAERHGTDQEITRRRDRLEAHADEILREARARAERLLQAARNDADDILEHRGESGEVQRDVEAERVRADDALRWEHAMADATLWSERKERKRVLAVLLALERSDTDRQLLVERERADDVVSARDDFLGVVSHDLRHLLGGIAFDAALLIRHAADDAAGKATVRAGDRIQRMTARMNRLIGDLIDVVSIEAGRLCVDVKNNDAGRVLRETAEVFRPIASAKGLLLTPPSIKGRLVAKFDEQRIFQVLANLVGNAIKFSGEGARISLGVERDGTAVRFSVADTGPGIPSEERAAIFEKFRQVRRNDARGLGLGLYIAKRIIDEHNGRIWVESTVGAGSTFYFTLPATADTDSLLSC